MTHCQSQEVYQKFDTKRKIEEAHQADKKDIELKALELKIKSGKK